MAKFVTILLFGLLVEAIGVVYLSQGLKEIGEPSRISLAEIGRLIGRGATNPHILGGILLEMIFFGILLYLLSQKDVSLVWPLTSLGFVLTALAARFLRHEEVSGVRWMGVGLIVLGASLVAWSEGLKKTSTPPETVPVTAPDPHEKSPFR